MKRILVLLLISYILTTPSLSFCNSEDKKPDVIVMIPVVVEEKYTGIIGDVTVPESLDQTSFDTKLFYSLVDNLTITEDPLFKERFNDLFDKFDNNRKRQDAPVITITSADVCEKDDDIEDDDSCKKFKIGKLEVEEPLLYASMEDFLDRYGKKHFTEDYCEDIVDAFMCLIEEDGSNIYSVLYFMALCSVESNFDQNVPTKYGVGIAQVIYRIHKQYISELGVSKENFYNSPRHNIYVGYNIFKCYLKSCKQNWHKTATKYNGNATKGYAENVQSRFDLMMHLISKKKSENR